jgi:hypothetical protein
MFVLNRIRTSSSLDFPNIFTQGMTTQTLLTLGRRRHEATIRLKPR